MRKQSITFLACASLVTPLISQHDIDDGYLADDELDYQLMQENTRDKKSCFHELIVKTLLHVCGDLYVKGSIKNKGLGSGVVHANSDILETGQVEMTDLANNSVGIFQLQDESVTKDKLAFKLVSGTVNTDGTTAGGSGFSSAQANTGEYTITFDASFANATYQVITSAADGSASIVSSSNDSATQATVNTYDATGTAQDTKFSFLAIGY